MQDKTENIAVCAETLVAQAGVLMRLDFSSLQLFATAGSAALHRRHLMVWKIFAPRFIFEAASFGLTTFVLLCVFVVVMRIDSALRVWTEKLQQQCETLEL